LFSVHLLLDKWNLIPGDPWQPAIEEALAQSDTCVVFFGPLGLGPWQGTTWVEFRHSLDEGMPSTGWYVASKVSRQGVDP
jgi:hypothetical protein